jgi:predicted DCC family thiol-disulfide oxidoreductase YuxK
MDKTNENILLFDGVCNLCNGMVSFIIKRDTERKFRFASLQAETSQLLLERFGLSGNEFESFVLIKEDQYFLKSTAALKTLRELGGIWKLLYIFIYIPRPLRDFLYDMIAKSRYKVFGKRDTCMIPTPELEARFL